MPEESNINPTSPAPESPATVDVPPPTPVTPTEAPPIEMPPIVAPEPISAEASTVAEAMVDKTAGKPVTPPPVPVVTPTPAPESPVRSLLAKALAKIQFRKQAKLEKIMVLARERGQVANDDVQKLLRVSDATATRYLSQLAKAGRLRRAGKPSHATYQPIP